MIIRLFIILCLFGERVIDSLFLFNLLLALSCNSLEIVTFTKRLKATNSLTPKYQNSRLLHLD